MKTNIIIKNTYFFLLLVLTIPVTSQSIKASLFGYTENDATNAIKNAVLSEYDTVIVDKQNSDWVVRPLIFENVYNKVIIFETGVKLCAKSGSFENRLASLLIFKKCKNISMIGNGAVLQMNKNEYSTGEWRHCISLLSSNNVFISNFTLRDSGGDGLYIGKFHEGEFSEDIVVEDIICDNNRRQGMSIISAKNVKVSRSIFKNTFGTLPGAGVDLEPNNKSDRIENINFYDCIFEKNDHAGVVLAFYKLETSSRPVSVGFYNCLIENNHSDDHEYIAGEITFNAHKTRPVTGTVIFKNCIIKNSKWGLFYSSKTSNAYKVTFQDCAAINICKNSTYPAIYLETPDYYSGSYSLGGYMFDNLLLEYETDVPYFMVRGSKASTLNHVSDVNGIITVINSNKVQAKYIKYNPSKNINYNLDVIYRQSK